MADFTLTCCSTADMPAAYFEQRRIRYVCFHFIINGVEYADDLGKTIPFERFFQMIKEGAMPTTSQVNTTEFISFFEPILKEGNDILHFSLSSGISGEYSCATQAREALLARYPERKITVIDTLAASSGYGLLVDRAADLRDAGKTMAEIAAEIEATKLRVNHWFFSTDLSHYKRGGRISAASAMMGTLLNICPLMNVSNTGKLIPRRKIHGKKKVIQETFQTMVRLAENRDDYSGKCFICHSACADDARALANLIEAHFLHLDGKVRINSIGTVIGSHTGPGTVALFFWGDARQD